MGGRQPYAVDAIALFSFLPQMVKEMDVNPHAKEAWKVTKSSAKGTVHFLTHSHILQSKSFQLSPPVGKTCTAFKDLYCPHPVYTVYMYMYVYYTYYILLCIHVHVLYMFTSRDVIPSQN